MRNMSVDKVVLTGARGFIGKHLKKKLENQGYQVTSLIRPEKKPTDSSEISTDFQNQSELQMLMEILRPNFFIHLASKVQPGRENFDLAATYQNEVQVAANFALSIPKSCKLSLFCGSADEYGNSKPPFLENQPQKVFSAYGWGKAAAYHAVTLIANQRGLDWCWVRPFLIFGPLQKPTMFLSSTIKACIKNETLQLTLGEQTRDFLYVEDLCEMFLRIIKNSSVAKNEIFNLCSGEQRSIRSVGNKIYELIGSGTLNWGSLPYRANEAMSFYGSTEKFVKTFGQVKLTPFDEALKRTVEVEKRSNF